MMRDSTLLVAIASVASLTAEISSAQDAEISSAMALAGLYEGEYYDVTWLRALKLESAPFLNPELLNTATIAYKFNSFDIPTMIENGQEIIRRLEVGDIDYCKYESGSCDVVGYDENPGPESWQDELIEALSTAGYVPDGMFLVDKSNELEDFSNFGAIVAWEENNRKFLNIPTMVDRLRVGDIGYCKYESGSCNVVGYDENPGPESWQDELIEALSTADYVPDGMFLVDESEGWKGFSNVGAIVSWEKEAEIEIRSDFMIWTY